MNFGATDLTEIDETKARLKLIISCVDSIVTILITFDRIVYIIDFFKKERLYCYRARTKSQEQII